MILFHPYNRPLKAVLGLLLVIALLFTLGITLVHSHGLLESNQDTQCQICIWKAGVFLAIPILCICCTHIIQEIIFKFSWKPSYYPELKQSAHPKRAPPIIS